MKKTAWTGLLAMLLSGALCAQELSMLDGGAESALSPASSRLKTGINLYSEGRWRETIAELRKAQKETIDRDIQGEILFWISLAELSAGDFEASLADMERLEIAAPMHKRIAELAYHKGRVLYFLGRYNDAILTLKAYMDTLPSGAKAQKAASLYWTGESLYAMGLFDDAAGVFAIIAENYPESTKFEAASYRIDLIKQKKVESELLNLLQWSHEESLKTIEEYQRRERAYDQAIIAYQKKIADLLKNTRIVELEQALAEAEKKIKSLEGNGRGASPESSRTQALPSQNGNQNEAGESKVKTLMNSARDLEKKLNTQNGQ